MCLGVTVKKERIALGECRYLVNIIVSYLILLHTASIYVLSMSAF